LIDEFEQHKEFIMKLQKIQQLTMATLLLLASYSVSAQDTIENYIREYPNQQQTQMMNTWLEEHEPGTFNFSGLVDPTDGTVITPQATVDYGYNWFSLSEGPAIIRTPKYGKFFSVSIFDMKHNVPAVLVNPGKPILLIRPGQMMPEGDFHVVKMETDQGLVFTRMVVVNNIDQVRDLSKSITMEGGKGSMRRDVQRFSPSIEQAALHVIKSVVPVVNPDVVFGAKTGDTGELSLAAGVMQGQLGTPSQVARYGLFLTDASGAPLTGDATYQVTVPAGIVKDEGYFSVTVYGVDNKLLIPNDQKRYDRSTYTAEKNSDGTYTVMLSPTGEGKNGVPTGKDFYIILRAYMPVQGASMKAMVEKQ
jgi:hypothetical protein